MRESMRETMRFDKLSVRPLCAVALLPPLVIWLAGMAFQATYQFAFDVVAGVSCLTGLPYAFLIYWWRKGRLRLKLFAAVVFFMGWGWMVSYVTETVSILFGIELRQISYGWPFPPHLLAGILFYPTYLIGRYTLQIWTWSYYDRFPCRLGEE